MTFWHIDVFPQFMFLVDLTGLCHNLFQTYGRDHFFLSNIRFGKSYVH